MKIAYNSALYPPAPFLSVQISPLTNNRSESIPAKIDTGADITAIPSRLIDQLGLVPADEIQVEGYDRRPAAIYSYDIILRIDRLQVAGLSVIALNEDYALLGRDVLNQLKLLLDGPALNVEILGHK